MRCVIMLFVIAFSLSATQIEQGIVKIFTVSKVPDYHFPWNVKVVRFHGSGAIIEGKRILTNAHVVANATFIEVKRHGDTKRYRAKVQFISHQADLALLTVEKEAFFKGVEPLEFGGLPSLQERINVYGFPMGGSSMSVTTGVVSRIEDSRYVHSRERFLAIQIDAAINPGSSGGPALNHHKIVGVVMQQIKNSQNIGYLIPTPIIKHFLKDVEDGHYDGFAELGFEIQKMRNPASRKRYGMDEEQTGVRIFDICTLSSASKVLQNGDILLSVDGHAVQNNGTVDIGHGIYSSFTYFTDQKQMGEGVELEILRNRDRKRVKLTLRDRASDLLLVGSIQHDVMPRYYIHGGYVFVPLTRNLLMRSRSSLLGLRIDATQWASETKKEDVILLKVLADESNRGNQTFRYFNIDTIDGKKVLDFDSFVKMLKQTRNPFTVLQNKRGVEIVIDNDQAKRRNEAILKNYNIEKQSRL